MYDYNADLLNINQLMPTKSMVCACFWRDWMYTI